MNNNASVGLRRGATLKPSTPHRVPCPSEGKGDAREDTLPVRGWVICALTCLLPAALLPAVNGIDWEPLMSTAADGLRAVRSGLLAAADSESRRWIFLPAMLM